MTAPEPWRLPWGLLLTSVLLAGAAVLTVTLRLEAPSSAASGWTVTVVVGVVAAFLAMGWLQSYFWGVVAALLVLVHPLNDPGQTSAWRPLLAEALALVTVAGAVAAGATVYHKQWAWRSWLVLAVALSAASGAAWQAVPASGLLTSLLLLLTLPPLALLAWRQRCRRVAETPALGNVLAGLVLGLGAPIAGLLLGCLPEFGAGRANVLEPLDLLEQGATVVAWKPLLPLERHNLQRWCWPTPWATVPLLLWGGWCTLRRGKWEIGRQRPPTAWVLALFALLELASAGLVRHEPFVPVELSLGCLAVLLAVFGVGDVFRNVWDQLRLAPPDERVGQV
jgi:hypothetical protein